MHAKTLSITLVSLFLALVARAEPPVTLNRIYKSGEKVYAWTTSTATTSGTVAVRSGATLQIRAGGTVTLNPGFSVETGGVFGVEMMNSKAPTYRTDFFGEVPIDFTMGDDKLVYSGSADWAKNPVSFQVRARNGSLVRKGPVLVTLEGGEGLLAATATDTISVNQDTRSLELTTDDDGWVRLWVKLPAVSTGAVSLRVVAGQYSRVFDALPSFALPSGQLGSRPDWWFSRGVLTRTNPGAPSSTWPTDYAAADDYAVANVGQLKNVASKAAEELNKLLPFGAGAEINQMVAAWKADPSTLAPGVVRDDYAAVSAGQLKNVAAKFYDVFKRLNVAVGPVAAVGQYPWPQPTQNTDDYAVVNLGQLKHVFSFNPQPLREIPWTTNGDSNSMPDAWERFYFGNTGVTDGGDGELGANVPDGLSNALEYVLGTNPTTTALTDPSDPANTAALNFVVFEAY